MCLVQEVTQSDLRTLFLGFSLRVETVVLLSVGLVKPQTFITDIFSCLLTDIPALTDAAGIDDTLVGSEFSIKLRYDL